MKIQNFVGKNTKNSIFFKIRGGGKCPLPAPPNDVPDFNYHNNLFKKHGSIFLKPPYPIIFDLQTL